MATTMTSIVSLELVTVSVDTIEPLDVREWWWWLRYDVIVAVTDSVMVWLEVVVSVLTSLEVLESVLPAPAVAVPVVDSLVVVVAVLPALAVADPVVVSLVEDETSTVTVDKDVVVVLLIVVVVLVHKGVTVGNPVLC